MKRLVSIVLVIVMIIVLSGCAKIKNQQDIGMNHIIERLGFTIIDHVGNISDYDNYVVYDNDTGVVYFLGFTSGGITLCPRYDSDGEIMIYGGK